MDRAARRSRLSSGTSASAVAMKPFMSAAPRRTGGPRARRRRRHRSTRLAVDRDHVGVTGQHEPGALCRADAGEQIGLRAGGVEHQLGGDAEPVEIVAHELDQSQVGVAAGGVEPDQPIEHLAHVEQGRFRHSVLVTCARERAERNIGRSAGLSWTADELGASRHLELVSVPGTHSLHIDGEGQSLAPVDDASPPRSIDR